MTFEPPDRVTSLRLLQLCVYGFVRGIMIYKCTRCTTYSVHQYRPYLLRCANKPSREPKILQFTVSLMQVRLKENKQANLLNQPPRNRVERLLVLVKHLKGERTVRTGDGAERRAAEFHPSADDPSAVRAGDPARGGGGVLGAGDGRGGVEEGDLVEAPAELGVGRAGQGIDRAEVGDVCGGEGGVGLEAFEEDDWGRA